MLFKMGDWLINRNDPWARFTYPIGNRLLRIYYEGSQLRWRFYRKN